MSSKTYDEERRCGHCGLTLDIDASYMNRKYHKYNPNCGQRHTSFQSKIRRGLASDIPFVVKFTKWASNQVESGQMTEMYLDPLMNKVLRNGILPLIENRRRRK